MGPSACALAGQAGNASTLASRVDDALLALYKQPLRASPHTFNASESISDLYIRLSDVEGLIDNALALPCISGALISLGTTLDLLLKRDADALYGHALTASLNLTSVSAPTLGPIQTFRGDGPADGLVRPDDVLHSIKQLGLPTAPHFADSSQNYFDFSGTRGYPAVHQPPVQAVGTVNLRAPVLFIGGRLDPTTVRDSCCFGATELAMTYVLASFLLPSLSLCETAMHCNLGSDP